MTGLERNADVVKLASYAPLLANEDYVQWRPDMIWFNNHASWGSASYEMQKLFMTNVGDHVVPSTASAHTVHAGADHRRDRTVHLGHRRHLRRRERHHRRRSRRCSRRLLRHRRAVDEVPAAARGTS